MEYDAAALQAILATIVQSPLSSELSYRLDQALEVTDALWELVPLVVATGEQHDRQSPVDAVDQSVVGQRLSAEDRSRVRAVADVIMELSEAAADAQEADPSAISGLTQQDMMADPFGLLAQFKDAAAQTALLGSMVEQVATLSAEDMFYLRAYTRARQKSERTPMLLRGLFITAVGMIEPLVSRLTFLLLYYRRPGRFRSLADPALEAEVRRLCFGPPDKWRKSLVDELGVTTLATTVDWRRLTSLWEDRNVIVHRGSVTDALHSAKTDVEAGSVLSPDADAVRDAIDVIGASRYALISCVWAHLEPDKAGLVAQMVGPLVVMSLRAGRWQQAELLGQVEQVLLVDPEDKAAAHVNRWLAADTERGFEAIRAEVEAWDVAELPRVFTLARHILLRQDEAAVAVLREVLDAGAITQADIDGWQLFDRLRAEGKLRWV